MVNLKFWKRNNKEDKHNEEIINKKDEIMVSQSHEISILKDHNTGLIKKVAGLQQENIKLKEEYSNIKNLNNVLIDSYWNPQKEKELAGMLGMDTTPELYKERVKDKHIPDYSKNPNPVEINPALPKDMKDESAKGRVEEIPTNQEKEDFIKDAYQKVIKESVEKEKGL